MLFHIEVACPPCASWCLPHHVCQASLVHSCGGASVRLLQNHFMRRVAFAPCDVSHHLGLLCLLMPYAPICLICHMLFHIEVACPPCVSWCLPHHVCQASLVHSCGGASVRLLQNHFMRRVAFAPCDVSHHLGLLCLLMPYAPMPHMPYVVSH